MGELVYILAGFLLGLVPSAVHRQRQARGHLAVLATELVQCREACQEFARAGILAPLYRLPIEGTRSALSWLIAEGYLRGSEYDAIGRVVLLVDQVNRGLDRTADSAGTAQQIEHHRVQLKAAHLLQGNAAGPGKLDLAADAVTAARRRVGFRPWIRARFQRRDL